MTDSFDIRPYRENDERKIQELFIMSYEGRQMPLSSWYWRFQDNPSGCGVIELAWNRDMLAAHYAVTNLSMSIKGQVCLAGLSGTTMTHPSYRGQHLFPILAQRTYREMANRGMAMVWGFPNSLSHKGFVCDLGWQDIYEVPMLRLQVASQKITSVAPKSHVYELFDADERFDRFWEKIRNDYDILVCRNSSYIRWRYFSHPIEKYQLIAYMANEELKGYAVIKRYKDELQIVDLLIGRDAVEVGVDLIAYIAAQAVKENTRSVSLWLNVTHPLHHVLEKMGFKPEGPVTYWGGLVLNSSLEASLYDFRRWYFTMSDSDVF